jgi:hypothetical protein
MILFETAATNNSPTLWPILIYSLHPEISRQTDRQPDRQPARYGRLHAAARRSNCWNQPDSFRWAAATADAARASLVIPHPPLKLDEPPFPSQPRIFTPRELEP